MINAVSLENKWAMICQHKKIEVDKKSSGKIEDTPQYWTSKLKAEPNLVIMKELSIVLGGANLKWLQDFKDAGGLSALLDILGTIEHEIHRRSMTEGSLKKEDESIQFQNEVVFCLQKLTNNKVIVKFVDWMIE
jgi:hypothetical protein